MNNACYLFEKTLQVKWMYLIIYVNLQIVAWNYIIIKKIVSLYCN